MAERERKDEMAEIAAPAQRHIIKRPRLTKLLDEAEARIVLLVAPAGYGKTTLAREWLNKRGRSGAWFHARPESLDIRVWAPVVADALSKLIPRVQDSFVERLAADDQNSCNPATLAGLLTKGLRTWPPTSWLVIDDYHTIASWGGDEFFASLARAPINILITSRLRPEWVTSRDVLYGDVVEFNRDHLAMTLAEAEEVVADRSNGALRDIVARAEGWPAIVGLAAIAPAAQIAAAGLSPDLYDYLAHEVFGTCPLAARPQISQLAIPARLDGETLHAMFGDETDAIVSVARRVGLVSVSSDTRDLEMHPLIRSFLYTRLRSEYSPPRDLLASLIAFLRSKARWDEAFAVIDEHDLADDLRTLLHASLLELTREGRTATLRRWIDAAHRLRLDDAIVDLAHAEVLMVGGDYQLAKTLAITAADRLPEAELVAESLQCAGRSLHLLVDDEASYQCFERAYNTSSNRDSRQRALWGQFIAALAVDELDADIPLSAYAAGAQASPSELIRLHQARLLIAGREGGLHAAVESARPLIGLLPRVDDPMVRTAFVTALANSLGLTGQYDAAIELIRRAIDDAERLQLTFILADTLIARAAQEIGIGHYSVAARTLDQASLSSHADPFVVLNRAATYGRLHISTGEPERAFEAMELGPIRSKPSGMYAEYLATKALAQSCASDLAGAERLIHEIKALPTNVEAAMLTAAVRAIASFGGTREHPRELNSLVEVARTAGNIDSLICALRGCPSLVECLNSTEELREPLSQLCVRPGGESLAAALGRQSPIRPRRQHAHLLSPREWDVLERVCAGLQNQEIATQLFISPKTVKTHLQNIYSKLGVKSRTEAAMWAARNQKD
jgi:LuxR family maltose regulon positive regulatory protein